VLIPESIISELEAKLVSGGPSLQAVTVDIDIDPLEFVRAAHGQVPLAVFFGRPGGVEVGAIGAAWEADVFSGEGRLRRLIPQIPSIPEARFVVGFSFSESGSTAEEWRNFGPARLVLPQAAVVKEGESTKLVLVADGDPSTLSVLSGLRRPESLAGRHAADRSIESVPAPGAWMEAVEESVVAIDQGAFEKVVLARSVVVNSDVATEPFDLAFRLRSGYPGCYTYAWKSGDDAFVGASPELLASVRDSVVISEPLAGTTARGEGEDHDRVLGEQLMASSKNRHEHRVVIEGIGERLAGLTSSLEVPSTPSLRRMANVQHLSTHIEGTLLPGRGILDVVEEIHPTPAVGGSPTDDAVTMIGKLEEIDRGWYSGGVGWVGQDGDGEVALALRCALLRGNTARLFAGAGIVSGSVPQLELEETRLKFGPMLSLLTEA
jgi:isochorismate synthase